jgi:replicative DNA helicase
MIDIGPVQQERAVLGGMMLNRRVIWDVLDEIEPADFADFSHETIFRAIVAQAHENAPTDVLAVTNRLTQDGDIQRVGGAGALHEMAGEVPTASNAGYYAGLVKQSAIKRRLVEAGTRIVAMGNASEGDAFELAERARSEVDDAASTARFEVAPIGDSVSAVVESMEQAPRYWSSPWPDIDKMINGFRPGALYVFGARPGSGKTIMGLQAAAHLAQYGNVAFSSLEMDTADLTKRLFAMKAGVHMSRITRSELEPRDWEAVARLRPHVAALPLFIDDRAAVTVAQVKNFVRTISRRGQLTGVVVDYLQIMRATDPRKPRYEAIGEMTGALKAMSRELEVPVIALCQLNRESAGTTAATRRAPSLSDLRESGSIEQDADVVVLLQRGLDETTDEPNDELDVIVAKNRHGSQGRTTLLWEGQYARVTSYGFPD